MMQRDGQYWGAPIDDASALSELERLHRSGVNFLVIAWPCFWWLDQYPSLKRRLESSVALQNERVVIFDLRKANISDSRHTSLLPKGEMTA